jgi:tRNA A-37 threonylcarbamoyl transferase component Bud32
LRQAAETLLNISFPVWGVGCPIVSVAVILNIVSLIQQNNNGKIAECLAYLAICLSVSLICLLSKRAISQDCFIVDKRGIKLPRLLGTSFYVFPYIAWQDISSIKATVDPNDLRRCRLMIVRKRARPVMLSPDQLDPNLVEQFLLAAKMWAPELCDPSLDSLQDVLRIGGKVGEQASYTELWEEELNRRFCPTAYIALEPGRVLRNNSVKVVSHLAAGGLSALYLCQLDQKKLVVLKEAVIPEDATQSMQDKAKEMFEREASLLMKLDNPGIVHVLDCFVESGRNYMLLEYVNGSDLRQLVKQNGPQNETQVLEWAIQIANTLKYMHEREPPIIHRDLTPDNIVLRNDGQVVIVDFGAANEFIGNATGTFVGKHSFIAPEQVRGKATAQSDLYAFGCTLFFLLTGSEPEALCPSRPRDLVPTVSEELSELIESCTQLEASDRYKNVAQLIPVLRRLAAQCVVL